MNCKHFLFVATASLLLACSQPPRPIQVVADSCGLVALSPVTPLLPGSRLEFEVPTTDGSIRMTDYASVDCWEGSHICTWLPKNSYELRVTSYSRISYKLRATSYK